jgi:DNA-binding XRE family transcriptional regulator
MKQDDYMTGAEMQTLREACHLSREDLASLASVQARTVKHWENGRAAVPEDVADIVRSIDATIQEAAAQELHLIRAREHPSVKPGTFGAVLLRYKTESGNLAGLDILPATITPHHHLRGAIAARVQAGALWLHDAMGGAPAVVRVVWFDVAQFEEWRRLQGLAGLHDSHALRQQWAGQALANQAIPHRFDQPPA